MAENIEWVRHHEGPGTRIVVWAHNGHVEAASDNLGLDTMGTYLRRREGSNMVIFGFAFDEGSFQSIEMPFVTNKPPRQFTLGPAPEGSLDATLAGTGLPIYAVDLRLAPKVGPVADWLELRHTTRSIGSGFAMQAADQFLEPIRVANKYDAILYVKSTTAARPTPTVLRRVPFEKRPSPANLGLEEGDLGHTPAGWWSNTRAGYHAELADHDPKQGKRCAVIRHVEDTGVAGYGTLAQKVDAAHYRDKRVRVRGAVRTDFAHPSDQAYLWLRVEGVGGTPQEAHSAFSGPISTAGWQYFEVLQDVPKDADAVSFGLAMTGQGRAWLDDVSLEIVGNATPVVPVAGIPK
jgi:erythromycin esterase